MKNDEDGSSWALARDAQTAALALPGVAMAVTTDLGEVEDIHPRDKQPVGERLAAAMARAMGLDEPAPPCFAGVEPEGEALLVRIDGEGALQTREVRMNRAKLLAPGTDPEAVVVPAEPVSGFEVRGADGGFVPADAELVDGGVRLRAASVAQPVAARYGWANLPRGNVYDARGFPLAPFSSESAETP